MHLLEGKKILIADDNKLNQKIVMFVLEKSGAKVSLAFNGKDVLEQLGNNTYDAILMDLQMPEMDGLEATVYIRTVLKNDITIIGLTANTLYGEKEQSIAAGMNACVSKPFDPAALCQLILKMTQNNSHNASSTN